MAGSAQVSGLGLGLCKVLGGPACLTLGRVACRAGDGDCGSTLARGAATVRTLLTDPKEYFDTPRGAATALTVAVSTMGGTSGALYSLGFTAAAGAAQAFANPIYPKALAAAVGTMGGTSGALCSLGLTAAGGAAQAFANPISPKALAAAVGTMGGTSGALHSLGLTMAGGAAGVEVAATVWMLSLCQSIKGLCFRY